MPIAEAATPNPRRPNKLPLAAPTCGLAGPAAAVTRVAPTHLQGIRPKGAHFLGATAAAEEPIAPAGDFTAEQTSLLTGPLGSMDC